ncbi:hypothetical protein [Natronosalvus caseinilyticus]|uniref:hypothetical protein n=1 Tax=Natronosalvus caseinilyticus TaxID=2953747 RepID=UPI0028A7B124|nr:hypothetical protein [Natronosalvus caseinilyticus]
MIDISVIDTTIRATDPADNSVELDVVGWDRIDDHYTFTEPVDDVISARVSELALPANFPLLSEVFADGTARRRAAIDDESRLDIDPGSYRLLIEAPVQVTIRFDGEATIRSTDGELTISFPHPQRVSLGFTTWLKRPRETITVPRTPEGIATGLSHMSASIRAANSQKVTAMNRPHPPRIRYDDSLEVPDAVRNRTPETGIELRIPSSLEYLFPAAPLVYYLGARIRLGPGDPVLSIDGAERYRFESMPGFQYQCASLLRRVFLLDMLVRSDQHTDVPPQELDLFSLLEFDPATCVDFEPGPQLAYYLEADFERISHALPDWHFVGYVEPTLDHVEAIPYLLQYLATIYHPAAAPGSTSGGEAHRRWQRAPDTVPRRLVEGGPHGSAAVWMADGAPPDPTLFRASPAGFVNRPEYVDRAETAGSVVVVCNDASRTDECAAAVNRYRTTGPADIDLEVRTDLSCADLREQFERGADFLHFVGDCRDGLSCPDGTLALETLEQSHVRLFFLDGYDSLEAGETCIERGSVGGFVRGAGELNPAYRERLLGLFAQGLTVDQTVRYAALPADERGDVVALGDAHQQLARMLNLYCVPAVVEARDALTYQVEAYPYIPEAGFIWRPGPLNVEPRLCGNPFHLTMSGVQFESLVEFENLLPIEGDTVYWDSSRGLFYPLF